jgi:S1-C subfamily serine protease
LMERVRLSLCHSEGSHIVPQGVMATKGIWVHPSHGLDGVHGSNQNSSVAGSSFRMTVQRTYATSIIRIACMVLAFFALNRATAADDLHTVIRASQAKVVKIYGAGGLRKLEAYQSGILISPEGHVLTVLSYVLDTDDLAVVVDDGRKFQPELVGADPLRELALLKLPLDGETVPYFDLKAQATANVGERVLALSNLFGIAAGDESVSVLQGAITALAPLEARRGSFIAKNRDEVYVVDAYANNPGAAGGALVDWQGRLLGLLGKELKSRVTGTWLNYALPTASFTESVDNMLAGRSTDVEPPAQMPEDSLNTELLGVRLVPNVLATTPPYIDSVRRDSAADRAGLRPDDLIVFVGDKQVTSSRALVEELSYHEEREEVTIGVLRDGGLIQVVLKLADASPAADLEIAE